MSLWRRIGETVVMVAAGLGLAVAAFAEETGQVKVRIDTMGRAAAAGAPVSGGVPFPRGAVATVDHLRLETLQGTQVPANYWKLASWADGSVKSALISFTPKPSGDAYEGLILQYGPSVRHTTSGPVTVSQDGSQLTVQSDVLKLQCSKSRFSVVQQAWTDLNGDGSFASDEQWLSSPADLVVVDQKTGGTFRSALWTSSDGYAPKLVEVGPQKVTVLLEGRLKGENGAKTTDGDSTLAQAKIWLSVYAGSSLVHVQTTLVDTISRDTQSFSEKVMHLDSVALDLPMRLSSASYAAGGDGDTVYQGSVGSEAFLLQDADVTFTTKFAYEFWHRGVGSGTKAPGWMDVSAGGRGVTMGLRHFWQTFPHQLTATGSGLLRLEFVPSRSSHAFWTVYPGVGKTYEAFLDLHAGGYGTTVRRRAELALTPPLLIAEPAWYAKTEAFGPLAPPSSKTTHFEAKMERQYACTALRSGCAIYPQIYGQRDFGDYQQGVGTKRDGTKFPNYGDGHYEDAHGFLMQFVRTGERRWFDYAMPGARHHYDLDVMHTQNPPRHPGFPPGMIHWHGTAEHEGVNIEFGHIVPGGLSEYYLLTGDPRALDVIREQGNWMDHWTRLGKGRVAPEKSSDSVAGQEYERIGAWTLYTLLKAYEATNDPKYWESASILVKNTIDWWKMPQDHIVFDPKRELDLTSPPKDQALYYQRSDWTQGTGYPIATLRVANCAKTSAPISNREYQTHAPIAWMSSLLQTTLIRYYQELERRGGSYDGTVRYRGQDTPIHVDAATMREMLIQIVNMVVEHNYVGAPKYPSRYPWLEDLDYHHFVYSICPGRDPRLANGAQYFPWTLAFVSAFSESEVSSRWRSNWPALQAKWRDIAQRQYVLRLIKQTTALTGYNGVQLMWNMPYGVALMDQLGLLDDLPPVTVSSTSSTSSTSSSTTSSSSSSTTTATAGSTPAYEVTVDNGVFLTDPVADLTIVAPSTAAEVNVSAVGFGEGEWVDTASEIHGIALSPEPGTKTLYVQFRDAGGVLLAALEKSLVLVEPGFSGAVSLTLNEADDTFVFSNGAGANYGSKSYVTMGQYSSSYHNWGLFDFALPEIPAGVSATVTGASLELYLQQNTRNTSQVITPYETTGAWAEDTVTWNSRPDLAASPLGDGVLFTSRTEINRWKIFTLDPTVVQGWIQNPASALGLCLLGDGTPKYTSVQVTSSESFTTKTDHRPRLVLQLALSVTDSSPPPPSDPALPTAGPVVGDLTGDGAVTMADVTALLGQLVGLSPATPETADLNGDGSVSITDLQILVNRL